MIIGTTNKFKVGKIYGSQSMTDGEGKLHENVTFQVIREATKKEYLAWCRETSKREAYISFNDANFYEVSMD